MVDQAFPDNSQWTHRKERYGVCVFGVYEGIRVKDANDARWQPGLAYVREDEASPRSVYIRTRPDFLAKFEAAGDSTEDSGGDEPQAA